MRDVRLAALIRAIQARYPGTHARVERFQDPEGNRDIRWYVWILDVRENDLGPLREIAYRLAYDLFFPDAFPFHIGTIGRRRTPGFLERRAGRGGREVSRLGTSPDRRGRIAGPRRLRTARSG